MKNIVGGNYMGMSKKDYDKAVNDYFDLKYKNLKQKKENPFDIIFDYSDKPELSRFEKTFQAKKRYHNKQF